ncbi:MAG TPA: hypothetical protein VKZ53_11760 [Candidatus Angelobacter sp.]|nr:hypothetical protein [Candidatus Angelobacter sp.]
MNPSISFRPHPNLSDEINRNIVQSEVEGGVRLDDLLPGSRLQVTTRNTRYQLVVFIGNTVLITGHSLYCPRPVLVRIHGSTWGGSMLKVRFIGRGMCMEFAHPQFQTPILTSPIQEIRECLQQTEPKMALMA